MSGWRETLRGAAPGWLFWGALLGLTWAASSLGFDLYEALDARWIVRFPAEWRLPLEDWISAAYRRPVFERMLRPVLDLMQTVPVFAYLVPILFLFGFGPVSALVATIIYAMPPMVRVTVMALRGVPPDIRDLGRMVGCTRRQMMWKVLVPSALPTLMVGVNQVIMLSLNMVITASMIGAGGLGFDPLSSLRRLDIGGGITNFNVRLTDRGRSYVVRIGEDIPLHGVVRFNELAISRAAHAAGLAPAVHFHAPGALVLDFVEGELLTEAGVADPARLPRIVALVARCHRDLAAHPRGPVLTFWVFHVLRDYRATLAEGGSAHLDILPELMRRAGRLEVAVGAVDLVVGDNDLLAANILDAGDRLWLIDWEYGGFNSPLFDLGGLATNNGLTPEQERLMLEQYFDRPLLDATLYRYTAMKCASLLRETIWSMMAPM